MAGREPEPPAWTVGKLRKMMSSKPEDDLFLRSLGKTLSSTDSSTSDMQITDPEHPAYFLDAVDQYPQRRSGMRRLWNRTIGLITVISEAVNTTLQIRRPRRF